MSTDPIKLDQGDPLAFARGRFKLPEGLIYLDGNSLGALPAATLDALAKTVEADWGEHLIASWNRARWIDWPTMIASKLAPIVGAKPSELLIADSTSVCLHKLLVAAVKARPGRNQIVTDTKNFPSDLYLAQGVCDLLGLELKSVAPGDVVEAIDSNTAAVTLTHVDYRSAKVYEMSEINRAAEAKGALTIWDLSHSSGALDVGLDRNGCKLALGCGYKYLNGGPGSPAFIYVEEAIQNELSNPIPGWMGHKEPFAFSAAYRPGEGISRFLTGTPSILAMAALDAGISTFDGIAIADVQRKSRDLSELFIGLVDRACGGELELQSPREPEKRGSHVVFAHPNSYAIIQALIARWVIGDFREPNLMRFGFSPLYNSFSQIARAAEILGDIIQSGEWDQPHFKVRAKVT